MEHDIGFTTDRNVAIRAYINTILKNDPRVYEETERFMSQKKEMQEALINDRGMSHSEEFKAAISMPELLGLMVFQRFPEILESKKSMYAFMRGFPEFTTAPKAFKTKYDPR